MSLPAPLEYGIHDAWPHLQLLGRAAGFSDDDGRTEVQLVTALDRIDEPASAPVDGVGVASWLLAHAAAWLRLGGSRNLVTYVGGGGPTVVAGQAAWQCVRRRLSQSSSVNKSGQRSGVRVAINTM